MNLICEQKKCTACGSCVNICPKNAVDLSADSLGRTVAEIDQKKCVDCGLCAKHCPNNAPLDFRFPKKCYAAYTCIDSYQKEAASGGIASTFYKYVVEQGGAAFGVRYKDGFNLTFDFAETVEEINHFLGSQYVQAETSAVYKTVRSFLEKNREVLFVGTPCQVAGLLAFLGKKYENLVTIDIVCHGTPPFTYLNEYMNEVAGGKADSASFRGKYNFFMTFYSEENVIYQKKAREDAYFTAFLDSLTYRQNCYNCSYARPERVSDITIGDFWGLDRASLKQYYGGRISAVLLNTDKGEEFWNKCSSLFISEERNINEAINSNGQLKHPSSLHKDRAEFEENYLKYGFYKAVKTKSVRKKLRDSRIQRTILFRVYRKLWRKAGKK